MTNTTALRTAAKGTAPAAGKDLKALLASPAIIKRLEEIIGKNTGSFCASLIQISNSNALLQRAEPNTVISAAIVAATLNLPINNALGFAYIVPFNNSKAGMVEAQFQIGYKGLIQLAMRSGQIKRLVTTEIYANQIISRNPIKGYEFDFDIQPEKHEPAVGYYAYMELVNGFIAEAYMSVEDVQAHAARYSQTYKKGYGVWKDNFDEMAKKTVMKQLLSKYAPMSIELQRATLADQSVIHEIPADDTVIDAAYSYPDNDSREPDETQPEKPTLTESEFNAIAEQVKTGDAEYDQIIAQYDLTAEQKDLLDKL
jgi:recombinase, phage recT family|nr:MAG TPA: RecT protein [Caudoviricetes sp.]